MTASHAVSRMARIENHDDLVGPRRVSAILEYETDGNSTGLVLHKGADAVSEFPGLCGKRIANDNRDDRSLGRSRIEIAFIVIRRMAWITLDDDGIARR